MFHVMWCGFCVYFYANTNSSSPFIKIEHYIEDVISIEIDDADKKTKPTQTEKKT